MVEFLNKLNFGTPKVSTRNRYRFSDGGLVNTQQGGKGGQAGLTAVLGLDEGLLLKRLEASPEFHRVYVRTAQANQKAMKNAIGGGRRIGTCHNFILGDCSGGIRNYRRFLGWSGQDAR
jgi:hypothetical protein